MQRPQAWPARDRKPESAHERSILRFGIGEDTANAAVSAEPVSAASTTDRQSADGYMISSRSPADFMPSFSVSNTWASSPQGWGSLAVASMPANR